MNPWIAFLIGIILAVLAYPYYCLTYIKDIAQQLEYFNDVVDALLVAVGTKDEGEE